MTRQATLLSVLSAVAVVALWWFFLYAPGQEQLAAVEAEVAAAETEQVSLQQRVVALEVVRARAPETEAAIARLRGLVPVDPALPSALRQIQAAAEDAGVVVSTITTTRPVQVEGDPAGASGLHASSIAMTAEGSYFQLVDFFRRIEDPTITARGITFTALSLSAVEYPALTATVSGQMYAVLDPVPDPTAVVPVAPVDEVDEEAASEEGTS